MVMWKIEERDGSYKRIAEARQARLTKPTGALGALEDVAVWLADIQQSECPEVRPAAAIVFASDHPVSTLGVSAYPREVTPMMILNLVAGGAAASVLCRMHGLPLHIVDVGVEPYPAPQPTDGVSWRRLPLEGSAGDLVNSDAMDADMVSAALSAGAAAVDALPDETRIVVFGEMGIGNTTPASALAARLLDLDATTVVGPGTGVSGEALSAKVTIVERALERCAGLTQPLEVLRALGGREIAAIVGAMGRAAERGLAILVDGFIVSSAALVAVMHDRRVRDYMYFAHRSAEPGHARILDALDAQPLVDAGLRLGEGSGSLTAFPLIDAAVTLHNQMATFEQASVPDREG